MFLGWTWCSIMYWKPCKNLHIRRNLDTSPQPMLIYPQTRHHTHLPVRPAARQRKRLSPKRGRWFLGSWAPRCANCRSLGASEPFSFWVGDSWVGFARFWYVFLGFSQGFLGLFVFPGFAGVLAQLNFEMSISKRPEFGKAQINDLRSRKKY